MKPHPDSSLAPITMQGRGGKLMVSTPSPGACMFFKQEPSKSISSLIVIARLQFQPQLNSFQREWKLSAQVRGGIRSPAPFKCLAGGCLHSGCHHLPLSPGDVLTPRGQLGVFSGPASGRSLCISKEQEKIPSTGAAQVILLAGREQGERALTWLCSEEPKQHVSFNSRSPGLGKGV